MLPTWFGGLGVWWIHCINPSDSTLVSTHISPPAIVDPLHDNMIPVVLELIERTFFLSVLPGKLGSSLEHGATFCS